MAVGYELYDGIKHALDLRSQGLAATGVAIARAVDKGNIASMTSGSDEDHG